MATTNSNIARFMLQQKLTNFADLYTWSINNRAEFWQAAIKAVGFVFEKPYTQVLDLEDGAENPSWLVGAKLNVVASCFKAKPDKTAIVFNAPDGSIRRISYHELHLLANRVSNSLQQLNLPVGAAIAIDLMLSVEAVAIYLGIIQAGFIAVGIADSFAADEVAKRVKISQTQLIFTQYSLQRDAKIIPLYEKLITVDLPPIVVLGAIEDEAAHKLRSMDLTWQEFLQATDTFTPMACNPHDPSTILFSSGTTGDPKAIVWDHTSPIKCAVDGFFYQDIQANDIIAWPSSLGWMMGPWLIFAALINQATIAIYTDVATTRGFVEFVAKAQVTILGLIPSLVKIWRKHNFLDSVGWSKIKLFTSTGEISNPSDMQYLLQISGGKPVIEYCGGTEIAGAYITSTVLHENIPGMFSTPCLGLELYLLDENGKNSVKGEVALVPPSIGLSRVLLNRDNYTEYYANMPKTKDNISLRRHGDQMQCFENGYYRSLGRIDDTMNLGGIKISAAEIENCFLGIHNIIEAAAIGVQQDSGLTDLVIYVVLDDESNIDLKQLQQEMQLAINGKLNPLFKISMVKTIAALPRTNSHKIMRRVLRDLA